MLVRAAAFVTLSATVAVAQTPTAPIVEVYGGECTAGGCLTSVTGTVAALAVGGGGGGDEAWGAGSGVVAFDFVELTNEGGTDVSVGAGGAGYIPGGAYATGTPPGQGGVSSIGQLEAAGGGDSGAGPLGFTLAAGGSGGGAGGYSRAPNVVILRVPNLRPFLPANLSTGH